MANAVGFEGATDILRAPKSDSDCRDLQIFRTETSVISCWRLSDMEIDMVNKTGVIWLEAQGVTHPPIAISALAMVHVAGKPSIAEPYIKPPISIKSASFDD